MESPQRSNMIRFFNNLSLKVKLILILGMFTALAVANYTIVSYNKGLQHADKDVVNLAGRQRMLSQKIGFLSEQVVRGKSHMKDELKTTASLVNTSLLVLKNGGNIPQMQGHKVIPASAQEVMGNVLMAEEVWKEYHANVNIIINEPLKIDSAYYGLKKDSLGNTVKKAISTKEIYNPKVMTAMAKIERKAHLMLVTFDELVSAYIYQADIKQAGMSNLLLTNLIVSVLTVFLAIFLLNKYIAKPIEQINHCIEQLSKGDLDHELKINSKDEIGKALSNLVKLDDNLVAAANFAIRIGEGDFNTPYKEASDNDELGVALVSMRNRLLEVAEEDRKRNWASQGFEKFNNILTANQENLSSLTDDVLAYLINYLKANQGAIYLVENNKGEDSHLALSAIYAWGKKRYITKRLEIGEGVPGQVWREQMSIYLTEIPQDYVEITSGLGETKPRSILVVPLKVNDEIYGIIEIASLLPFETYQIEFVEKLAEHIASTVSSAQKSFQTQLLLEQTQRQSELTKAQEEEMRQTMEEIQATTEEMERKEKEYISRIEYLEEKINDTHVPSNEERTLINKMLEEEKHASKSEQRKVA